MFNASGPPQEVTIFGSSRTESREARAFGLKVAIMAIFLAITQVIKGTPKQVLTGNVLALPVAVFAVMILAMVLPLLGLTLVGTLIAGRR